MKKVFAVLVLAALTSFAFAQTAAPAAPAAMSPMAMLGQPGSLAEVYGIIDAAARFSTNATTGGGNYFGFSQGLFNGSRFGIRGGEDLGNTFRVNYDLEGGVILPTGGSDQQGQIFGRQAWLGVSSDYGTLTFGRQYGTFSDAVGAGDVFGVLHGNEVYSNGKNYGSNDSVNGFFYQEMGYRWDNSFKYSANFSGLTIGGMASLGGVAGDPQQNNMYAASIGFNDKSFPISGAVGFQSELDTKADYHTDIGGGFKIAFDDLSGIHAFYFHSLYDKGFSAINATDSELYNSGTPSATARTDDIANLAINWYITPQFNLIASYYFDYVQNVAASGDSGNRNSALLVGDFYFTKDFDIYLAGSYTAFNGVLGNNKSGGDTAVTDATAGNYVTAPSTAAGNFSKAVSVMLGVRLRF